MKTNSSSNRVVGIGHSKHRAEPSDHKAFLHFELYNCGYNFPTVSNTSMIPVRTWCQSPFDVKTLNIFSRGLPSSSSKRGSAVQECG